MGGFSRSMTRLVRLVPSSGKLSECVSYSEPLDAEEYSYVLIPFLNLLWWQPEYCHQQVQSEPIDPLLIPRHLYDNPSFSHLLHRLEGKLWEIYPDSFLLSVGPEQIEYCNYHDSIMDVTLPRFVELVHQILSFDSLDWIEVDRSLAESVHTFLRQIQTQRPRMSQGDAAYELWQLRRKELDVYSSLFISPNSLF